MLPRRKIEELFDIYRREPGTKDVFVEGHLDQALIKRFFRLNDKSSIGVFRIESIEVPNRYLLPDEMGSEKGRLMALARILEEELGSLAPVRCIVDRDFDYILKPDAPVSTGLGIATDFSSSEMYFFDHDLLDQVLSGFLRSDEIEPSTLLHNIEHALATASTMFAANLSLGLECGHIDLDRCCEYDNKTGLSFDSEDYLTRYLNKGSAMQQRPQFESEMARIRALAPHDGRRWYRGRDYLALLEYVLRNSGVNGRLCTQRNLEGAFTMAIDLKYLLQFRLFNTLSTF